MKMSSRLAIAGFLAGGLLTCVLELKPSASESPTTADPAGQRGQQQVEGKAGAASRPEPMWSRLQRAGDWLHKHAAPAKRERAPVAYPKVRQPVQAVRSSAEKNRKHTVPAGDRPAEPRPQLRFRMHRFLAGQQVVTAGVMDESTLRAQKKHGKYLVYWDLSVTNEDGRRGCRFSYEDFRLQGNRGLVYTPVQPRDYLSADLRAGATVRGGVAFAIYGDSAPSRLLYRTGPDSFAALPESFFLPER